MGMDKSKNERRFMIDYNKLKSEGVYFQEAESDPIFDKITNVRNSIGNGSNLQTSKDVL